MMLIGLLSGSFDGIVNIADWAPVDEGMKTIVIFTEPPGVMDCPEIFPLTMTN